MTEINNKGTTELETFLPNDGSNIKDGVLSAKYKVQVTPHRDPENGVSDAKGFDPFIERKVSNPTTDCDTLTHLLKASLGTGILAMPKAFSNAGSLLGIIGTILVAFVCTHCSYVLVKCAHVLYHKTRRTEMGFADVSEAAFTEGPKWGKKFAIPSRYLIQISLFVTYFGTCSVYTVIIAANFQQVVEHHLDQTLNERYFILMMLLPIILMTWVPDLKWLAPVSMIANIFMATGLGITFYYLVRDIPPVSSVPLAVPLSRFPEFFSLTIFAMEAIGVVMPLENSMKTPRHFVGICGVLNKGMSGVTLIYILLGFLGYVRYGDAVADSITLNLRVEEIPAQAVKILIALAVFCTFGLQFYVCLDIAWNGVKERFQKKPLLANYVLRSVMALGCVLLAVAVPTISPFIGLIGAFCFSILGLLVPVVIETVTYWDVGFGPGNWVAIKNVVITIIGILALVFGSRSALVQIIALNTPVSPENIIAMANTTMVSTTVASMANSTVAAMASTTMATTVNILNTTLAP